MVIMRCICVVLIGKSVCGFKVEINADICGGVKERDTVIGLIYSLLEPTRRA